MIPGAVTVDLDGIDCYHKIYQINSKLAANRDLAEYTLRNTLPGIRKFLDYNNIKATLFVIGKDLDSEFAATQLRRFANEGHELANHSFSHPYALPNLPEADMFQELERAHKIIQDKTGVTPVGFRTPGYHLSDNLRQLLENLDYLYSSSMMTSVTYWLAKYLVVHFNKLFFNVESAVCIHPFTDVLKASIPTYPDKGSAGDRQIMEIPVSTGPFPLQIPLVGSFISLLPFPFLFDFPEGYPPVLNFHALDFWPDQEQIDSQLRQKEVYLKLPLAKRMKRYQTLIDDFKRKGIYFTTLDKVACSYRI
ncbi:MAG: polysaccharide deacetylase family protein [Myxococcota bacterium]